jgi:transcriptional regulator with XRE-family HTH domain
MAPPSSTVATWELATRLRARRQELGVEVATISEQLGFTRNYWSAVENGRTVLAEDKLQAVVALLRIGGDQADELYQLREISKLRGWWQEPHIRDELALLLGLEHGAERVRSYEGLLVTGLLQTDEYARAVMLPHISLRPVDVERQVAIRIRRQERLTGDLPLHLTAVMNEATLRQHVGEPGILERQLRHIVSLAESRADTVDVRVLLFSAPPSGVTGAATFYLLDFDSPHLPTVAWQETMHVIGLTDNEDEVHTLELAYERALELALSRDDSLTLIEEVARHLEQQPKTV